MGNKTTGVVENIGFPNLEMEIICVPCKSLIHGFLLKDILQTIPSVQLLCFLTDVFF